MNQRKTLFIILGIVLVMACGYLVARHYAAKSAQRDGECTTQVGDGFIAPKGQIVEACP